MTRTVRHMVWEGHVFLKQMGSSDWGSINRWLIKHEIDKRSVPAGLYWEFLMKKLDKIGHIWYQTKAYDVTIAVGQK